VIEDRLLQLVSKARVLLLSHPQELTEALECFAKLLPVVAGDLDSLYFSGLPDIAAFDTTIFANELPLLSSVSSESQRTTNLGFLSRAITSHLHTQGCSAVLGRTAFNVNGFVESMALLLSDRDRARSSLVVTDRPYVPDLVLQGVCAAVLPPEELIRSPLPTTVIDLDTLTVQQTHPFNEYITLRREYLAYQIDTLTASGGVVGSGGMDVSAHPPAATSSSTTGSTADLTAGALAGDTQPSQTPSSEAFTSSFSPRDFARLGMLRSVKSAAPCVEQMVREVFLLPVHLRQGFVMAFHRLVVHRAITLTKYVCGCVCVRVCVRAC
jgi:C9orf72-like protein family